MSRGLAAFGVVSVVGLVLAGCAQRTPPVTSPDQAVYEDGDDGVELPSLVEEVKPRYPDGAKEAGITGSVMLSAVVDREGRISDVEVTQSLDEEFGLDAEAVSALRQWRFSPGTRHGEPIAVRVEVEMTFNLRPNGRTEL